MNRLLLFVLVLFCVAILNGCEPEPTSHIKLKGHDKVKTKIGWLATTQVIALQFGVSLEDVDQVVKPYLDSLKQKNSTYLINNQIGKPMFEQVGLNFDEDSIALTWNEIKQHIDGDKKPIVYSFGGANTIGHILIIMGYTSIHGTNYLHVYDPEISGEHADRYISYEEYVDPNGMDTRWTTWYNFERKLFS